MSPRSLLRSSSLVGCEHRRNRQATDPTLRSIDVGKSLQQAIGSRQPQGLLPTDLIPPQSQADAHNDAEQSVLMQRVASAAEPVMILGSPSSFGALTRWPMRPLLP